MFPRAASPFLPTTLAPYAPSMAEPLAHPDPNAPPFSPQPDPRALIPEPPPVRLLAISDFTLPIPPGHEKWLDTLYLRVLKFESVTPAAPALRPKYPATLPRPGVSPTGPDAPARLPGKRPEDLPSPPGPRWYRAENLTLHYQPVDRLVPEQIKTVLIEVPSLEHLAKRLMALEIPYDRIRGLLPGLVHLQLFDPAGHLIQISAGRNLPL